jgi:hypothetical protein
MGIDGCNDNTVLYGGENMSDAKTILEMIEAVSPDDTAKLDEIDARVVCYLAGREYQSHGIWKKRLWVWVPAWIQDFPYRQVVNYTRSRDALKEIRPKNWWFSINQYGDNWSCNAEYSGDPENVRLNTHSAWGPHKGKNWLRPTEELAELHAIIQAIEYERTQSDVSK